MLSNYRRQALDEYFTRLLIELDVDEELAQLSVQETLDFEGKIFGVSRDYPNSILFF